MTLADYQSENDWRELSNEEKINVLSTHINDLENEVAKLEQKYERLDRDIGIVDRGASV